MTTTSINNCQSAYTNHKLIERYNELGICAGQLSALQLLLQEPVKDQIASKMDEEPGCAHAKIRGLFGEDEEIIFFEVVYFTHFVMFTNTHDRGHGFFRLSSSIAKAYNGEMDKMKAEMRKLHSGQEDTFSYRTTLSILFAIRLLCLFTAWHGNVPGTIFLSALQGGSRHNSGHLNNIQ